MKTILIFLIALVTCTAYGQNRSFKIVPYNPDSTVFRTYIALYFSPSIPKDSTWTDKKIWETFKINDQIVTIEQYDRMVSNFKFIPLKGQKVVHVRFKINGRTTDYTFEQFRKILWP